MIRLPPISTLTVTLFPGTPRHRSARSLIDAVRGRENAVDTLDALVRQYSLDTQEGLMRMCLAEALVRVPDAATDDALIRDKLNAAEWERHLGQDRKRTRLNSSH